MRVHRMAGYSPGWNDPPPLSYSQVNLPGGKRNLLNKRVPFPLNDFSIAPQQGTEICNNELDSSSPISSNIDGSITSNTIVQKEPIKQINTSLPEEEILTFVIQTFEKILSENSDQYEEKRIEEINQRIKIMKESWDFKISLPVKQKMLTLAQELSNGNAEAALKIQCILMVDYLREVKQWMVGVKHIIEMERQNVLSSNVSTITD